MSSSIVPDPEPENVTLPTADIIPFPVRLPPVEMVPKELSPNDRLARALETLNKALAEQKVALAAWRGALGALQETTTGLGDSLRRYQTSLGTLGDQVTGLHDRAITMEQWADSILTK